MSGLPRPYEMLILAGGFGTRLQSVINTIPKPMAPVGNRPFLAHLLDYWLDQGIQRFVLSTGHLGHVIQQHFGTSYRDASIEYVHEKVPLGTGGALRLALNSVAWTHETALLTNGDTWFSVDLRQLCADAGQQQTPITIALKAMGKNDRYGGVEVDTDRKIRRFGVQAEGKSLINAGCYLLNVKLLKQALATMPEVFSLEQDFLADYAAQGLVGSSLQDQPFLDIGIPEDYYKASHFLQGTSPDAASKKEHSGDDRGPASFAG